MSNQQISFEDWMAELSTVNAHREEGITVGELSAQTGMSRDWVLSHLRLGKRAGLVQCVIVSRTSIDGRPIRVPGYQFLKPKKGAKRR